MSAAAIAPAGATATAGASPLLLPAFNKDQARPPALLFSTRLHTPTLTHSFPPAFKHGSNKLKVYKDIIYSRKVSSAEAALRESTPLRYSRYDSSHLPIDVQQLLHCHTKVTLQRSVYDYVGGERPLNPEQPVHWYFNFADAALFGYYVSSLFAQDEWQCMEHPSLASLVEWAGEERRKQQGERWQGIPKTVTHLSDMPIECEKRAGEVTQIPTPCTVMHVPREVEIDAVTYNIYGNNFSNAPWGTVAAATKRIEPLTFSNIVAAEALKYKRGRYTAVQIAATLQTAITAFTACRLETQAELEANGTLTAGMPTPPIVLHTGNWGCGAFGGNIQLMCILQILAARIAGIAQVVYHVLSDSNENDCKQALKMVEEIISGIQKTHTSHANSTAGANDNKKEKSEQMATVFLGELCNQIAALGFEWGRSNGT